MSVQRETCEPRLAHGSFLLFSFLCSLLSFTHSPLHSFQLHHNGSSKSIPGLKDRQECRCPDIHTRAGQEASPFRRHGHYIATLPAIGYRNPCPNSFSQPQYTLGKRHTKGEHIRQPKGKPKSGRYYAVVLPIDSSFTFPSTLKHIQQAADQGWRHPPHRLSQVLVSHSSLIIRSLYTPIHPPHLSLRSLPQPH
jgi:hypothetical protein